MVADPLTKGKTLRHVLNTVLHDGEWVVEHETKKWSHKAPTPVAILFGASVAGSFSSTFGPFSVAEPISLNSEPTRTLFQ
eukprot:1376272-Prorocentrum_lima.AAC.1